MIRVVDGNWESGEELGNTWQSRNVFSYGREDKGQARPEVLNTVVKNKRSHCSRNRFGRIWFN